jgi:hypothetical protein
MGTHTSGSLLTKGKTPSTLHLSTIDKSITGGWVFGNWYIKEIKSTTIYICNCNVPTHYQDCNLDLKHLLATILGGLGATA